MKDIDPEARFFLPAPPAPTMPPGLVALMEDMSRNVLRNSPEDIFAFCAEHLRKLLVIRDGEDTKPNEAKKSNKTKIDNAVAEYHKRADKRRVSYDRWLAQTSVMLDNETAKQEIVNKNDDGESQANLDKSITTLESGTEQPSQTLELHNEKSEYKTRDTIENETTEKSAIELIYDLEETETAAVVNVNKQLLNEPFRTKNEMKSLQDQKDKELDDKEEKYKKHDQDDLTTVLMQKAQEEHDINYFTCKDKTHEDLEHVKKTVSDIIAEIEIAAINIVTNLSLNLDQTTNSVVAQDISPNHIDQVSTDSNARDLQNPNNEINIVKNGFTKDVTDLQEQILDKAPTELNVKACDENIDAETTKPSIQIEAKLECKEQLSMNTGKPQEIVETASDKNKNNLEPLLAQEELHVQKHISDLEVVNEDLADLQVNVTDSNDGPPSIEVDSCNENSIHYKSKNEEQKEKIENSIILNTALNHSITQGIGDENYILNVENIIDDQPIITNDKHSVGSVENDIMSDNVGDVVESPLNDFTVETATADKLNIENKPDEIPLTEELGANTPKQEADNKQEVKKTDKIQEVKIKVIENSKNSINSNYGEEETTCNNLVTDIPRSLKTNDSEDTDDATNGISAEVDTDVCGSENVSNPIMNLETAAVTIQKVFRSFLFKSRTSTIDDETPLDIPYLPDAIHDSEVDENIVKVEEEEHRILNKERRNLGLIRMDTVLQTVNEEKSLSLSDDSATLSSAATVIQAHVRGYLARNNLRKARSEPFTKSQAQSSELDPNDPQINKTVLNIHIVPEGSHFLSRDESSTLSLDLPLDASPPSLTSYHSLGYDITERRKLLKREDAIQSISPPSTNSGKSEDVPLNDMDDPDEEHPTVKIRSDSEDVKGSDILSGDTTPTVSTAETVIEVIKEMDPSSGRSEFEIKSTSDEYEDVHLSASQEKDISSEPQLGVCTGVLHSGEFHDVVLPPQPTQLSRDDPKHVAREFKNNLVYFLIWN